MTYTATTPIDSIPQLVVREQKGLVLTEVRSSIGASSLTDLLQQIKDNPLVVRDILDRLRAARLSNLKDVLSANLFSTKRDLLDSMIDRMTGIAGDRELIAGLSVGELMRLAQLLDQSNSKYSTSSFSYNGQDYPISNNNYDQIQRLIDGLTPLNDEFTETMSYTDTAGSAAYYEIMASDAIALGVESAFQQILVAVEDEHVKHELIVSAVERAAIEGQSDFLLSLLTGVGYGVNINELVARYPNLVKTVLSNYRFKENTPVTAYAALKTQLFTILEAIAAGGSLLWYQGRRNGSGIVDLGILQVASPDAETLIRTDTALRIPMLTARTYPPKSGLTLFKETYPLLLLPA